MPKLSPLRTRLLCHTRTRAAARKLRAAHRMCSQDPTLATRLGDATSTDHSAGRAIDARPTHATCPTRATRPAHPARRTRSGFHPILRKLKQTLLDSYCEGELSSCARCASEMSMRHRRPTDDAAWTSCLRSPSCQSKDRGTHLVPTYSRTSTCRGRAYVKTQVPVRRAS